MRIERLVLGELSTNCWLVSGEADGPLIVIDPAGGAAELLEVIGDRAVSAVVLTHGHFDHLAAAGAVLQATRARLLAHAADAPSLTTSKGTGASLFGFDYVSPAADRTLAEGDLVSGGDVRLRVLHTPGHTPGGISLLADSHLFSGDTLFAGSVGRTDFAGGDPAALRRSLDRLSSLPDDTVVHPGHGPETTIGRERRVNPFFPRG